MTHRSRQLPIIPGDLAKSLASARVRLFVGSGVSSAASLTSWDKLITEMKIVIETESNTYSNEDLESFFAKSDHLEIADVFKATVQDHRYYSFLRSHYRRDVPLSKLHRAISRLPITTIFTTNYDKLLERAYRDRNGIDPPVIIFPEQLGYIEDTSIRIIKLHGDIDHPKTVVLTRMDYANYGSRHREFEQKFHNSVNEYTMLFVGFGLRDPNFKRIYYDARGLYDSGKRLAYAIMTDTNQVERDLWEKDQLKILPAKSYSQVATIIEEIRASAKVGSP